MTAAKFAKAVNGNLKTISLILAMILALGPGWFWAGAKSGQISALTADRLEDLARQAAIDEAQDIRLDHALGLTRELLKEVEINLRALRDEIHMQNITIATLSNKLEGMVKNDILPRKETE